MQPYLFPYIGYFQLFAAADVFVVYDDVKWIKGGWINRNRFLCDGKAKTLTLPLVKRSSHDPIGLFEISETNGGSKRFLETLATWYKGAPFYRETLDLVEFVFAGKDTNLVSCITRSFTILLEVLGLKKTILLASKIGRDTSLTGQDSVIDVCTILDATCYVNAKGGKALYDREQFAAHDIRLKFLQPRLREYHQFASPFVPGLSIVDLLMFNGCAGMSEHIHDYSLI